MNARLFVLLTAIACAIASAVEIVSHKVQPSPKRGLAHGEQYWDNARRQSAIPIELDNEVIKAAVEALKNGPQKLDPEKLKMAAGMTNAAVTPPLGTNYVSKDLYGVSPYSSVGKVFFVEAENNKNYVCSGSVVHKNLVLTAGHCVAPGKDKPWHLEWVFSPQYYSGGEIWEAEVFHAFSAWVKHGNLSHDVAFVTIKPKDGKSLGDVFPALAVMTQLGKTPGKYMNPIGYPVAFSGGNEMIQTYNTTLCFSVACQEPFVGIYSHLSSGSSGGPWIYKVSIGGDGDVNYAAGLNSFSISNSNQEQLPYMFSPYFSSEVADLINAAVSNATLSPSEVVSGPIALAPGFWNDFYGSTWFYVAIGVGSLLLVALLFASIFMSHKTNMAARQKQKKLGNEREREPLLSTKPLSYL